MQRRVVRIAGQSRATAWDHVATEEPLEIRLGREPFVVTMRTPGRDVELVAGLLFSEGVVTGPGDIRAMRHCVDAGRLEPNLVEVTLGPVAAARAAARPTRRVTTTSACGLCGATSIAEVRARATVTLPDDHLQVSATLLAELPERLRAAQPGFERTGGLHAAGLFDASGGLVHAREDVGRHNALDKVVGRALLDGRLPLAGHVVVVSGRASFELVQKAVLAGAPVLAAVSAPSSLAVALADTAGLTLVGFLRGPSMNVYTGPHRITGSTAPTGSNCVDE